MKYLIAVVNCHQRLVYQQCVRETWLPLVKGADVRFFLGPSDREPQLDEVFLDCDDSYEGLPSKVRAIARWASAQGYDYVCKLDDDVVIKPSQFLNTGFQNYEFSGHRNDIREFPVPFGFCYWMNRQAMQLVASAELPNNNNDEAWVTKTLSKAFIKLHHEPRYVMYTGQRADFVPRAPRGLRAPIRPQPADIIYPDQLVAWCMYFNWAGFHKVPDERIISEMRKVFNNVIA
jgi:hypothetical protein